MFWWSCGRELGRSAGLYGGWAAESSPIRGSGAVLLFSGSNCILGSSMSCGTRNFKLRFYVSSEEATRFAEVKLFVFEILMGVNKNVVSLAA